MPTQYVYLSSEALKTGQNPSAYTINSNQIKINLGGMFRDIPPYVKVSLIQCEVQSEIQFSGGVVLCSDFGASNYRNLANTGTCLAILPDETKQAGIYHYVLSSNEKPEYIVYGNLEQFTLYFTDYYGDIITFTEAGGIPQQMFGMLLKFETPPQDSIVNNYSKSIPYVI